MPLDTCIGGGGLASSYTTACGGAGGTFRWSKWVSCSIKKASPSAMPAQLCMEQGCPATLARDPLSSGALKLWGPLNTGLLCVTDNLALSQRIGMQSQDCLLGLAQNLWRLKVKVFLALSICKYTKLLYTVSLLVHLSQYRTL